MLRSIAAMSKGYFSHEDRRHVLTLVMLTAASSTSAPLGLFRLTLDLRKSNQPVPPRLREHFDQVLAQAKRLWSNPRQLGPETDPESIDLAYLMARKELLRAAVEAFTSVEDMSSQDARTVLTSMEQHPVHTD